MTGVLLLSTTLQPPSMKQSQKQLEGQSCDAKLAALKTSLQNETREFLGSRGRSSHFADAPCSAAGARGVNPYSENDEIYGSDRLVLTGAILANRTRRTHNRPYLRRPTEVSDRIIAAHSSKQNLGYFSRTLAKFSRRLVMSFNKAGLR